MAKLGRPKKVKELPLELPKKEFDLKPIAQEMGDNLMHRRSELKKLLMAKMHACYDREPTGSYTGYLDTLVVEIINIVTK